ncbi:hypothetical protein [Kordia sp.]|uniref:hypothetical protein n=1 Tax=Kordia sp. TaxID=1965332 RepID=UPI003D6A9502
MKPQKRIQLKPHLSIDNIGKTRFWTGVVLGICNAVVFYLFTFYSLEFMVVFNISMNGDLPLQTIDISFFEATFLAAISLCLGITMMIRHWFMRPTFRFIRSRKNITLRISNYSLFIFYLVLYAVIIYIRYLVFGITFTGKHQPINYTSLFFIIPLYLFFVAWSEVSRYFVVHKWIISTFLIGLFTVFLFTIINIKPAKFSEKAFKIMHSEELEYADSELKKAKEKYNITFSEETQNSLKELHSERALNLLTKVRMAFKTKGNVSLDTIILEKILIHNFKGYYRDRQDSYAYIFPFQAYEQLRKVDPKSSEATELLNIIIEFYNLSVLMYEIEIEDADNLLHSKKMNILQYQLHNHNPNEYGKMYSQTFFLIQNIQKLNKYDHPFFNREFPPAPPSLTRYYWKLDKFPEFKNTHN